MSVSKWIGLRTRRPVCTDETCALKVGPSRSEPLAPERGRVYEAGLKFEAKPGITGTLAIYQIDKQNVAVTVGDSTLTWPDLAERSRLLNYSARRKRHRECKCV